MPSITIIGAGVAGLSAADVLLQAGWQVQLLEKARKAGGRCATRRLERDSSSPWFDFGAQYFTARNQHFLKLVQEHARCGWLQTWQPQLATWTDNRLSASNDQQIRWVGTRGLNSWLAHYSAELEQHAQLSLTTHCRANHIEKNRNGWRISTSNQHGAQQHYSSDFLLITAPPEQAQALLETAKSQLCQQAGQAAKQYRSQPCWASSFVLNQPATNMHDGIFCSNHPTLSWAANNRSKDSSNHPPLWSAHANPVWSQENINQGPNWVSQRLQIELATLLQQPQNALTPVHTHRWLYARPASSQQAAAITHWQKQSLGLAGDWLAGGRVEGAWLSGRQAALQWLQAPLVRQ